MIDGHVHLEKGPLSVAYCMEFVEEAVKKGITTLQILDHTHRFLEFQPLYERLKRTSEEQKSWFEKKMPEPLQAYFDLIAEMKQKQLPIEVRFGLEVCYAPEDKLFLKRVLSEYPYDFLVGSIHSIDGRLYDMEAFSREILWEKFDTDVIYRRYYEIMEDMIESDLFTQIGHPDQLKLFHYMPSYDLKKTYERIAAAAKKHRVAMEHNTGIHYRYGHADLGTDPLFLSVLKKHGVTIITASDAHVPADVGRLFSKIQEEKEAHVLR